MEEPASRVLILLLPYADARASNTRVQAASYSDAALHCKLNICIGNAYSYGMPGLAMEGCITAVANSLELQALAFV